VYLLRFVLSRVHGWRFSYRTAAGAKHRGERKTPSRDPF
jgi:hypothetical protein